MNPARIVLVSLLAACASHNPQPLENVSFQERAETQTLEKVTVTVAILRDEEARAVFGVNLAKREIQPVWREQERQGNANPTASDCHQRCGTVPRVAAALPRVDATSR